MKLIFAAAILALAFWIGAKAGHIMDRNVQPRAATEDLAR
jgi:hypothetical protein